MAVQISEMRDLLDHGSWEDNGEAGPQPFDAIFGTQTSPPFLFPAAADQLSFSVPLHPPSAHMSILWDAYEHNVAPLIKIFHVPTLKQLFHAVARGDKNVSPSQEPIFFAIYFSAVVSLSSEQCSRVFGKNRLELVTEYRSAAEKVLAEVGLLSTCSVLVLQAFTLFLFSLRRCDDTRLLLSYMGIAVRIATSLGLHRDGSRFGLSPFETEIGRRLWWHLLLLDADLSEDHGVDPLIQESYDTKMPQSLNDKDLRPEMPDLPSNRQGLTDITPLLVRFEICLQARRLLWGQAKNLKEKSQIIDDLQKSLQDQFLAFCSEAPLEWATKVFARAKCTMLWISVYHPLMLEERKHSETQAQATRDRLFLAVTQVVESVHDLESNPKTSHWGWFFHSDVQWPALVYLLHEIINRPPGPSVTRAWNIVKQAREQWNASRAKQQQGMLWGPMRALTSKALMVKDGYALPKPYPSSIDLNMDLGNSQDDVPRGYEQSGLDDNTASYHDFANTSSWPFMIPSSSDFTWPGAPTTLSTAPSDHIEALLVESAPITDDFPLYSASWE